jgi:hypothetical protein
MCFSSDAILLLPDLLDLDKATMTIVIGYDLVLAMGFSSDAILLLPDLLDLDKATMTIVIGYDLVLAMGFSSDAILLLPDLLDLDKATISADDHSDRLALALFSTSTSTTTTTWESFNSPEDEQNALQLSNASEGKAGWELALVSSVTNISKPMPANRPLAGGFDPLLLDSMYSQGEVLQKQAVSATPAGSASSVAIPNRPAGAFLALPAPPGGMPLAVNGEDPFAASAVVPPPAYVQMADLATKRELLTQEQVMWQRYQMEGMRGESGFQKLFNNPYAGMPAPTPMMYQNPYQVGMP